MYQNHQVYLVDLVSLELLELLQYQVCQVSLHHQVSPVCQVDHQRNLEFQLDYSNLYLHYQNLLTL